MVASAVFGAAIVAAVPAHAATTAITVKGTQISHLAPYPEDLVPGLFLGDTVTRIDYPAKVFGMDRSVAVAVAAIAEALESTPGPVVVAGFSQGAIAVARAKLAVMAKPADQRPTPDQLSFITIGDPLGPRGFLHDVSFGIPVIGLSPTSLPDTPYDTVIVNGEYDGWADVPDRPGHLLSLINAVMGIGYVHGRYEILPGGMDLSTVPERNITVSTNSLGGRTTEYLVPTPQLPLVQPLRDIGVPEPIVAALEKPLKAAVDAGYSRNDVTPAIAATASVPTTPRSVALTPRSVTGNPRTAPAAAQGQGPGAAAATEAAAGTVATRASASKNSTKTRGNQRNSRSGS